MHFDLIIVFALVLLNGFFALSEMSVMLARKSRLRQLSDTSRGAKRALALAEAPENFLSAVQVWISLLGICTGYFGGESLALLITPTIASISGLEEHASSVAVALALGVILFVSVVVGELVPKRLATLQPENLAKRVAIPMHILAITAKPAVAFLTFFTRLILRIFRVKTTSDSRITEEEIRHLVAESSEQGVIDTNERNMVNRVLTLGDRQVESLMTPRTQIAWLDVDATLEKNLAVMRETPYSRYPVRRSSDREIMGVLQIKHLVNVLGSDQKIDLFAQISQPIFFPENGRALQLLEQFRDAQVPIALVVDEYGEMQGLVTVNDLLGAVVGRQLHASDSRESSIVTRADGSWLIDGRLPTEDLRELLSLDELPDEDEQDYHTAAGMMVAYFGRIPDTGEAFNFDGFRFEVVDLDGARVDKILVTKLADESQIKKPEEFF